MHHHRGVHAGERAALEQEDLAAAALLGRRADDADREPDVVGDARRGERRRRPPIAAMMLWPQAWPMPGSASYSAQIATCSGPEPGARDERGRQVADAALDREAGGVEQRRPSQPAARSSSKASSGWAWMRWLSATSVARGVDQALARRVLRVHGSRHRVPVAPVKAACYNPPSCTTACW